MEHETTRNYEEPRSIRSASTWQLKENKKARKVDLRAHRFLWKDAAESQNFLMADDVASLEGKGCSGKALELLLLRSGQSPKRLFLGVSVDFLRGTDSGTP